MENVAIILILILLTLTPLLVVFALHRKDDNDVESIENMSNSFTVPESGYYEVKANTYLINSNIDIKYLSNLSDESLEDLHVDIINEMEYRRGK